MSKHTYPAFGDILNIAIQIIKSSGNKKSGIAQKTFSKELINQLKLTDKQLSLTYKDTTINCKEECFKKLFHICVLCLEATGLIREKHYSNGLQINTQCDNFLNFVAFNETVNPDNLIKLDPFGKIFFWLANYNFDMNINLAHYSEKENYYISDFKRFDKFSFIDLKSVNKVCYGESGDQLLNFLIDETMCRTSVFMNNYADVPLSNDFNKATHDTILKNIKKLTPTQFEHLCLKVIASILKKDTITAILEILHTGKTNDGGIDGKIVKTLDNGDVHHYYIQAKLHQDSNKISNRDLRNFVGAYPPNPKFHHGIFITTSDYTANAIKYKNELTSHNLTLINQLDLLELMMECEIGVETIITETMILNKEFYRTLPK